MSICSEIDGNVSQNIISVMSGLLSPVGDLQADCQSSTSKVFRYQKILQGTSFHILATAIGRSPSVLGTIDADKVERVAKLSGAARPSDNPKVIYLYFLIICKLI